MWARLSIVAGLVVGIAVAGLLLGGLLAFAPEMPLPSVAPPSIAAASVAPSAVGSPTPSVSTSVAPSSAPSASTSDAPSSAPSAGTFYIGQPAPPLVVPQVGGGTIDLASLKGNPVWVTFMATSCPSCQDEFPLMNGFAGRYANQGLVIIAVDVQEDEAAVAAFADGLGASFPVGLDSDRAAADAWDANTLPVHFWIDAEGIVRHAALGGIGPDKMVEGLKSIMPGVDVTP